MSSFQKLWENMQSNQEQESSTNDDKINSILQTGINVDENFWDNFLLVINNSEGLSALLDVPETKISTWYGKIKKALEKQGHSDDKTLNKKARLINQDSSETDGDE